VFIEEVAPELIKHHAESGTYQSRLNQCLIGKLSKTWKPGQSLKADRLEGILSSCDSGQYFERDPALILNHMRIIRNNVIHRDTSVQRCGGDELWGERYLRYYEAFLEELKLVSLEP